ncbi:protein NRT1/ PTR FAMILY 5.5-like isoform X2 [Henckelia pumila]|uniref:protein NRT1/ PTR FAMILY 5.5-like isoform X2 n=1 Tax=Henckelia pumila TaxID=405737 RepID=UPI003C6E7459
MATVARVVVLLWVDILASYAIYVMMAYLTNVWDFSFTKAAAIVNVFWGFVLVSPLFLTYIVDTILGNYWMVLISSVAYSVGLGLLAMSTPPVLANSMGNCKEYKPECIGHGQEILFYIAMPLIAFGMAGHMTSFNDFLGEQLGGEENNPVDDITFCKFSTSVVVISITTFVAVIGLPYIKPWSIRFGIPAICTLFATVLFFSGSRSYAYHRPQGSPMTAFFRVFVAAVLKRFHQSPRDPRDLYEFSGLRFYRAPHTKGLRCLDKAAIVVPTEPREEQENKIWRLCTVTEVEETKVLIRMIPVWMTFIICGVVSAIGFTFFVEQLEHLNPKVGRLKVPIVVLLWFFEQAQKQLAKLYVKFAERMDQKLGLGKLAPLIGISISMIIAILCCVTAAKVEKRRLGVVQRHGLIDKTDERIPMTMFWLLPQFVLLGLFTGIFHFSAGFLVVFFRFSSWEK